MQTLQFAKVCFTVTIFLHCSVQSLPAVEWYELHGIVISRYLRYFSRYRGTAIYRDLDDTGIVTFGITILAEVSQTSQTLLYRFLSTNNGLCLIYIVKCEIFNLNASKCLSGRFRPGLAGE